MSIDILGFFLHSISGVVACWLKKVLFEVKFNFSSKKNPDFHQDFYLSHILI